MLLEDSVEVVISKNKNTILLLNFLAQDGTCGHNDE